jgi:hypothetical protein
MRTGSDWAVTVAAWLRDRARGWAGSWAPWLAPVLWAASVAGGVILLADLARISAAWVAALTAGLVTSGDLFRQHAQRSERRREEAGQLIRDQFLTWHKHLPRPGELSPTDVGVRPGSRLAGGPAAVPGDVPVYVRRDIHERLVSLIRQGRWVLIEGPSAAGKTRTAYETVREAAPNHQVLIPLNPAEPALEKLVRSEHEVRPAVVWLDDIDRYLKADTVNHSLLTALSPGNGRDVAIVATLRAGARKALQEAEGPGGQDRPVRTVNDVLGMFESCSLGSAMSPEELARARRQAQDPRIESALHNSHDGRITEYLSAVPALLRHWKQAEDEVSRVGAALVSAAVDWRRVGRDQPVPAGTLAALLPEYLVPAPDAVPPELLQTALAWATAVPPEATSACLTAVGDGYLASDILVDHAQTEDGGRGIPDRVWELGLADENGHSATTVSMSALSQGRPEVSEAALRRAAGSGDAAAMNNLGFELHLREELDTAKHWYEQAALAGNVDAMYNLGVLEQHRNPDLAERWYRRAAERGYPAAMYHLGKLLERRGQRWRAARWRRRAGKHGYQPPARGHRGTG